MAPRYPDALPVGGPIAGALESLCLHKGFQQIYRVAIEIHPVPAHHPCRQAEQVRCQILDPDPGQDEKARVVRNKPDTEGATLRTPAQIKVPRLNPEDAGTPRQTTYGSPVHKGHVFQVSKSQNRSFGRYDDRRDAVSLVVVAMDEVVPQRLLRLTAHHFELDNRKFVEFASQRFLGKFQRHFRWNVVQARSNTLATKSRR